MLSLKNRIYNIVWNKHFTKDNDKVRIKQSTSEYLTETVSFVEDKFAPRPIMLML